MTENNPLPADEPASKEPVAETPVDVVAPPSSAGIVPLDASAFAELIRAAQQSGLSLNTDAIRSALDREYREGRYQRAFDVIEGVSLQLTSQAMRRQNDLRQQEMQYKSGTLKMSPKDWMLRQRQATEQTQRIERARRQFVRVLDGLAAFRAMNAPEQSPLVHKEQCRPDSPKGL